MNSEEMLAKMFPNTVDYQIVRKAFSSELSILMLISLIGKEKELLEVAKRACEDYERRNR